jgi:hypothetical protein
MVDRVTCDSGGRYLPEMIRVPESRRPRLQRSVERLLTVLDRNANRRADGCPC